MTCYELLESWELSSSICVLLSCKKGGLHISISPLKMSEELALFCPIRMKSKEYWWGLQRPVGSDTAPARPLIFKPLALEVPE